MKYKLMAVDIDGTLLDGKSVLRDETVEAIRLAVSKGLIFTIATGRPIQGVEQFNTRLNLDLPYITYNGAMVVMGSSKEILYEQCLTHADAARIYALGIQYGTTIIVWSKNRLYVNRMDERARLYGEQAKTEPELISDAEPILASGVTKILWYDEIGVINGYVSTVGPLLGPGVNFHTSKPFFLEFVDKKASKAIAMEKLGAHFGITREEMIAVGDGDNDLSMIEYAGLGVAMGNANDTVKKAASYITLSNDEHGVAHVINEFILKD